MQTLHTDQITPEQLDELDKFARSDAGPELRDLLLSLSRCVRAGDELVIVDGDETITPSQAAERLGMSRTHLYKLLDRGEILSHRVGHAGAAFRTRRGRACGCDGRGRRDGTGSRRGRAACKDVCGSCRGVRRLDLA